MYFWPKIGQNGQNKNFPRHNTDIKWSSKQLSPISGKVLDKSDVRFQRKRPKTDFWIKMAKFWTKKGSKNGPDFFVRTKIFIDHF